MPFVALIAGAILIVVAFNNSAPALVTQLETDIPGYFKWAAALAAVAALGYIPGLRVPSRWLLGLVMLVLLLTNYQQIFAGFQNFASSGSTATPAAASTDPLTAYATSGGSTGAVPATEIAGSGSTASTGAATASQVASSASSILSNPSSIVTNLEKSIGFGGLA
jgi:uncharacterized membrane protein YfcA